MPVPDIRRAPAGVFTAPVTLPWPLALLERHPHGPWLLALAVGTATVLLFAAAGAALVELLVDALLT